MDFDILQGVMVLERTPREMLLGLPSACIEAMEGAETWSPDVRAV